MITVKFFKFNTFDQLFAIQSAQTFERVTYNAANDSRFENVGEFYYTRSDQPDSVFIGAVDHMVSHVDRWYSFTVAAERRAKYAALQLN